jgi:hypothetical protein
MAAGGPGDHPVTDIIKHRINIFSNEIDEIIRECFQSKNINSFRAELNDLIVRSEPPYNKPDYDQLKKQLLTIKIKMKKA